MRLNVGVDLDGVCAAFSDRFRQLSLEAFGLPDPPDAPQTGWDWPWITKDQEDLIWRRINNTKNFWTTLGKEKGTELLRDAVDQYNVFFITTRARTAGHSVERQSCDWLYYNYDIDYPQVIVTKHKGEVAAALELFAFIDDKPSNCAEVLRLAPTCAHSTYLRDQTYNREYEDAIRVPSLDILLKRLP